MSASQRFGLPLSVYVSRRQALAQYVGESGVAIIPTASECRRNRDVHFPFRPTSDFAYLTGFGEPDAVLVCVPGRSEGEFVLFCRPKDPEREIWDGYRVGVDDAPKILGVDQAFACDQMDEMMPTLLSGRKCLHFDFGDQPEWDHAVLAWLQEVKEKVRTGVRAPEELLALSAYLHEARLIKSPDEIALMQQAADISVKAHIRAMKTCKPGLHEYHLESALLAEFIAGGARSCAYPSIVGGGRNACVLHYIENNAQLNPGDLVLIDAGAELHFYAADITRTFPINGVYSGEQKALYEVVLQAQLDAIDAVKVGARWSEYDDAAVKTLVRGLVDLGLLQGDVDALIEDKAHKRFYMHRTGHWLGMDVHDVGSYKVNDAWRALEPGMVLTVEPGLYVAPHDDTVDERWRGIGIRIEDNVVVQESGPRVLTEALPKSVVDIEALMAQR